MAQSGLLQGNGINARNWESALQEGTLPVKEPPPWLAASIAEFRPTLHILSVVRPIRAISFGGILVFAALLAFLLDHSPVGQSVLLIVSMWGLPICVAVRLVASWVERRLNRKKNHIEQRMFDAGLHLDEEGRVLTDNPHPVLILDPATPKVSQT